MVAKQELLYVTFPLNAANIDTHMFVVPAGMAFEVQSITHCMAATAASATCGVKKCAGVTAPASGTLLTTAALAMDSTANTNISTVVTAARTVRYLGAGDKLGLDFSGTLTGMAGLITVVLKRIK